MRFNILVCVCDDMHVSAELGIRIKIMVFFVCNERERHSDIKINRWNDCNQRVKPSSLYARRPCRGQPRRTPPLVINLISNFHNI